MPPSGYSPRAVQGSLQFIGACYKDLLAEVRSGKYATYEEAIEAELKRIGRALEKVHLDNDGNLVEK